MEEKKYRVYEHVLKTPINGIYKRYIGCTKNKVNIRWGCNGKNYRNNKYLYPDIVKYGWDGFEHSIIKDNLEAEEAFALETKLIRKYKTYLEEYGYNSHTSDEHRICRQELLESKRQSMYGKNLGENSALSKTVYCLETRVKYACTIEASKLTGVDSRSISRACRGKQFVAGNLHWRYEEDYVKLTENEIKEIVNYKHTRVRASGVPVKIKCVNNGKIYSTIKEASLELNLNAKRISDVVNNKLYTTKGYTFERYAESED